MPHSTAASPDACRSQGLLYAPIRLQFSSSIEDGPHHGYSSCRLLSDLGEEVHLQREYGRLQVVDQSRSEIGYPIGFFMQRKTHGRWLSA